MTTSEEQIRTLYDLIKDHRIAMLTTRSLDGERLLSRPLGTQEVEFDGDVWFATGLDSDKAREVQADPRVNVSYASEAKNSYVSLSGRASIVTDRAKIEQLWSPAMKVFFPGGKDDPDLCLIRVQVDGAEYWDGPGGMLGRAFYLTVAAISGEPGALSENETIDLSRR